MSDALIEERDRGLVELHRAGFEGAFAELYRLHFAALVRFCTRQLGGDGHLGEEVAQEAFCRAYLRFDTLEDPARFYPWVAGIARRLAADVYRQADRSRRLALRAAADRPSAGRADGPEAVVLNKVAWAQLDEALARLSPRQQAVLRMRDWDGLSSAVIAAELGIGEDSVRPLLQRARRALRRECRAITSSERLSAWLPVGMVDGLRRLRARSVQWLGGVPELSSLSMPAAQLVLGIGALMITYGLDVTPSGSQAASAHAVPAAVRDASMLRDGSPLGEHARTSSAGSLVEISPHRDGRPDVRVGPAPGFDDGVASVQWGDRGREDQRRAREEMPIYQPIGPFFIAVDPDQMQHDLHQATP